MRVEPHHTAAELAARIRSESRAKVVRRLTAVRLALLGHRPEDIDPQVCLSARQVRTWVIRYNAGGPAGLADAPGRGRKRPPDADQEKRLADRLRAGPTPADGVYTLRGEDIRRILRDEFGLVRSLAAAYHPLHALGFEPLRPPDATPNRACRQPRQGRESRQTDALSNCNSAVIDWRLLMLPTKSGHEVNGGTGCVPTRTRPGTRTPGVSDGGRGCRTPPGTRTAPPAPGCGWRSPRGGPVPS